MGEETCVRMRGGKYNDALCNDENGFNKKEKQVRLSYFEINKKNNNQIKGYICEHTPVHLLTLKIAELLECGQNTAVLPWKTRPGCRNQL